MKTEINESPPVSGINDRLMRDGRIDSIRGLLLILMTIDHLGGLLAKITDQPLGFVSALPGFIMISGFLYGRVYGRFVQRPHDLWMKSLARAWLIYKYHLILLLFILVLMLASPLYALGLNEYTQPFSLSNHPLYYAAMSVLLLHQPVFMDVLPVYAILVLAAPLVLFACRRRVGGLVIAASFLLWWGSRQFANPVSWLSAVFCDDCRYGYLNILSWQLIWVIGLMLGYPGNSARWLRFARKPSVLLASSLVAIGLFLVRHQWIVNAYDAYHGVNQLSLLRVTNVLVLLVPLTVLVARLPRHWEIRWLSLLGRYSLQVFTFHVATAYVFLPFEPMIINSWGEVAYAIFTLIAVGTLFIPAFWQRYRFAQRGYGT